MFSIQTDSDGYTTHVIDYDALSTSGLGNLISGIARLRATDMDDLTFEEFPFAEVYSPASKNRRLTKFSKMAMAMRFNLKTQPDEIVEVAYQGNIKVLRNKDGEGYKAIKNKMMEI